MTRPRDVVGFGGIYVEVLEDTAARLSSSRAMRGSRVCRVAQLAVDATDVAEREVNPIVAGPDGVVAADAEHAWNRRGAMGIRKSVGKNKKSNRPTEAASVERGSARRESDNARTAPKPKRGSR